jgi:hypothetical protein
MKFSRLGHGIVTSSISSGTTSQRSSIQDTSIMANEAAWLKEPKANVEIGPAQMYTPGPGDVLVKVESIGFNSIDAKIQK